MKRIFKHWPVFVAVILFVGLMTLPGPTTYKTESGMTAQGASYTAIWRVPGRPILDISAHAQVQNARGQNAALVYEVQEFGAATTATAASAGATASDTLTWAVPFPDNNYSVACQLTGTVTAVPTIVSTVHTATTVAKVHAAVTAAAASNAAPGFDCVAIHF